MSADKLGAKVEVIGLAERDPRHGNDRATTASTNLSVVYITGSKWDQENMAFDGGCVYHKMFGLRRRFGSFRRSPGGNSFNISGLSLCDVCDTVIEDVETKQSATIYSLV